MSRTIDTAYQRKIDEIAEKEVYWYGGERKNQDLDAMLVVILAKRPSVEKIVRKELGITDDDFRRALKKAEPGEFIWEEQWEEVNKRFGFDPPLPFPVLDWFELRKKYGKSPGEEELPGTRSSSL